MAKQMSFTDIRGITSPESYWRLVSISLDYFGQTARLDFLGYANKAARDSGKQPVGSFKLMVSGTEFSTWFGAESEGADPTIATRKQAYLYASQVRVIEVSPATYNASDGSLLAPAVMKSFFDGALDV